MGSVTKYEYNISTSFDLSELINRESKIIFHPFIMIHRKIFHINIDECEVGPWSLELGACEGCGAGVSIYLRKLF